MEEIIEKIREKVSLIDPALDVSTGSPFDREVLDYIRNQFGVGDLELDLPDMIIRRIAQLDDQILTAEGGALHEFLIKVLPAIFQVPRLEIQRIKHNQDLNNLNDMTTAEANRRIGNLFVNRREGDVAIGTVRAYFASPVPVSTNLTNRAVTASGLAFFPDGAFTASQNLVASQKENGLYFVDIPYVAEATGAQYNIDKGEISNIENMPGLVRATNRERFVGGIPSESNQAYFQRAKKSLAERSLNSKNSASAILSERFPNKIMSVVPIGFGDPEMLRDAFKHKPAVGTDGIVIKVYASASGPSFELDHNDADPSTIRLFDGTSELAKGVGFNYSHATGPNGNDVVSLTGAASGATVTVLYYRISGFINLVDTIPGSIEVPPLFPSPDQAQNIHIGGKGDIYVKPSTIEKDVVQIRNLDRFTIFKADDCSIEQDPIDFEWYLTTARGLKLDEVGAIVGDVVELVTVDANSEPIVLPQNRFTVNGVDKAGRRLRLVGVPAGFTTVQEAAVRIRMAEDRAIPLERLVAVDNLGDPVFLDASGNRYTESDPSRGILPVAPSMGFLNRDSSLPQFPRTLQTSLPMVATRPASVFQKRTANMRFADGIESIGDVLYLMSEENIASASFQRPWRRISEVTALNSLSLEPIAGQHVRNIYPADVRSLDVSGGVDGVNEAAGQMRIYFEKPLTLLMYGGNYGTERTRFTVRIEREVSPGITATFNLKYRLATYGPAGSPAILVNPEDFTYENGLYYIDVFVEGSFAESTRSDSIAVVESDLNLGDGVEAFIGDLAIYDELTHVVGELEFEHAGDPVPRKVGNDADGYELPVSAAHPYRSFVGTWADNIFSVSGSPNLLVNGVRIGDYVKELVVAAASYDATGTAYLNVIGTNTLQNVDPKDFKALGVQLGDVLRNVATGDDYMVSEIATTSTANDTLIVVPLDSSPALNAGTVDYALFKWTVYATHVIEDLTASTLQLSSPSTGSRRFVILSQQGSFRLKNPHIRLSEEVLEDGSPGNDPNRAFRAEGYWLDSRNPYDRSLQDKQYTFGVQELTLFRFTEGYDTKYLPNIPPTGVELVLPAPTGAIQGKARDNFTFFCGHRVQISGTDFGLVVGTSMRMSQSFNSGTMGTFTGPTANSVDHRHLRVFVGSKELKQVPYDVATAGTLSDDVYMYQPDAGGDRIYFSAANSAVGITAYYTVRVDSVVLVDGAQAISYAQGTLTVTYPLPATADSIARYINDNGSVFFLYAAVAEIDGEGDVVAGTYSRSTAANDELGESFFSRQLRGKDIQIDYEWSQSLREVDDYVNAPTTRSLNQDLLVRHGIPILANVRMVVSSAYVTRKEVVSSITNHILQLDQQALRTSELVRLPALVSHIPIPIDICGLAILENRRFRTYRSLDGISPRRIEAVVPGIIDVEVTS